MDKNYLQLNNIIAYVKAFHLSNYVWDIIIQWNYFERDTLGRQFVRAIDSISANVAEGFGRYHKRDKVKFYYYSLGSVKECLDWNEKSKRRELISKDQYLFIFNELSSLPREIHYLIKFTNERLTI